MAQSNAPVIIKRKKVVGGDGHHGGAWKVAYADFVTAMMAFFMLMWLLGATTEQQRKGIADYFNPTIPLVRASGGGTGAFGGDSVYSEDALSQTGTGAGFVRPTEENKAKGDLGSKGQDDADAKSAKDKSGPSPVDDDKELKEIQRLFGVGGESVLNELLRRHIVTRLSDEGLVIELFDTPGAYLFSEGQPTPLLAELVGTIVPVISLVQNKIGVQAHTRAVPIVQRENPSWTDTTRRADQVRALIEATGMTPKRLVRVTGFADRKPVTQDPMAVRNNRVEIVVLRNGS